MKKYNKYGANFKNPQSVPWKDGVIDKKKVREYLKRLFDQDASKGLKPYYYWHHQAQDVHAMDSEWMLKSQERSFLENDVELVETKVLTNQQWCGHDKVYLRIYRSRSEQQISGGVDALAFAFDWFVGSSELMYFSFHK